MTAAEFPAELKRWHDQLASLLQDAKAAAQSDDFDRCLAIADKLQQFIRSNPLRQADLPQTAAFDEMDVIARNAHDSLLLDELEQSVARIAVQSAELTALVKRVTTQTEANQRAAKLVRLDAAKNVLTSLTETINAAKTLKAELEKAEAGQDFTALAAQIDKALKALQDLHGAVAKNT